MNEKKTYTTPTINLARYTTALADNSYDPGGESGLIGISGDNVDAGLGQAPPYQDIENEQIPEMKRLDIWDDHR